ncbi:MAG: hypothetical protein VX194_12550 [Actinomycetota bacterium]|nr:hypothetical protein [Acidimicrobiaceae bacterium]MEC7144215.1 hypothetical protein [Actinomycetota bacterium]MEC7403912.1 hypothetical protein [Actinomycetota bacterium]MEC7968469.1 hypothetical protein [Actinomycetota bacterium]
MTSPLVHAQHRAELSLVAGGLSGSYPTEILDPSDALPLTTLIVDLGPDGDDRQRTMSVNVMPLEDFDAVTFLQFFVPMPFEVPAAQVVNAGYAAAKVNAAMALGHFAVSDSGEVYFRYMQAFSSSTTADPAASAQIVTMLDFHQETFGDVVQGVADGEIDVAVVDQVIAAVTAG